MVPQVETSGDALQAMDGSSECELAVVRDGEWVGLLCISRKSHGQLPRLSMIAEQDSWHLRPLHYTVQRNVLFTYKYISTMSQAQVSNRRQQGTVQQQCKQITSAAC